MLMNITVPGWLHVTLYFVAASITAATHLISSGSIPADATVVALLGVALSVINSVDPQAVAKKLPSVTLLRLAEQKKLAESQKS